MKMVVFGSLNIDKVYSLDEFVRPGQTVSAEKMEQFCGGKGFNQAIALRRAGNAVSFAGAVGQDGGMLLKTLDENGIDRAHVKVTDGATGHAIIQVATCRGPAPTDPGYSKERWPRRLFIC